MGLLNRLSSVFAGTALAALVLMTIASVVARYVFAAPFHWAEEVSGLLMIWIIMVGAITTERDNQHLCIPVLTDYLPLRGRAFVSLVTGLLSIATLGYCGFLGFDLAMHSKYKLTGILQISWFWIDLAVPVGTAGIILVMLTKLVRDAKDLVKGNK